MKRFYIHMSAGVFVLIGLLCLGWLSVRLGGTRALQAKGYGVQAVFSNIGGLRTGAPVVIAGVEVGSVTGISLNDYAAHVEMHLDREVELPQDSIASVKTRGLIGEKYIAISPGAAMEYIEAGGRIRETEPAVDLESLISEYAFGEV